MREQLGSIWVANAETLAYHRFMDERMVTGNVEQHDSSVTDSGESINGTPTAAPIPEFPLQWRLRTPEAFYREFVAREDVRDILTRLAAL